MNGGVGERKEGGVGFVVLEKGFVVEVEVVVVQRAQLVLLSHSAIQGKAR